MDWAHEPLLAKAKLYAQRADDQGIDSPLRGFWMSLSLELLARAALAKLHPVLLADPTQEGNIHYAFGIVPKTNPKSLAAKGVFARCSVLIAGFTDQMSAHCLFLANRRNEELHTGAAAFEGVEPYTWLPQTYEIMEVLLKHLELSFDVFLGPEAARFAVEMLRDRRSKLETEVKQRVADAKREFESLEADQRAERIRVGQDHVKQWAAKKTLGSVVDCPACRFKGALSGESLSRGPVQLDGENGTLVREVRVLPNKFVCAVCQLKISGYQELLHAKMGTVFKIVEQEDPIEFFGIIPEDHVDMDELMARYAAEEYNNE